MEKIPGVFVEEHSGEGKLTVSVGPQHPGSGHFRIIVTLDGDVISQAIPDPGFVHRGAEKMSEYRNYIQNIPHLERPSYSTAPGSSSLTRWRWRTSWAWPTRSPRGRSTSGF